MMNATIAAFAVACALGLALVFVGGLPILAIGASGVVMGVLYTGGPRPLGYLGLGDVLVFVYFGPAAVFGTHLLLTGQPSALAAAWGVVPGLLSVAILVVNNLRDRHTDIVANKRTLAVRLGARVARAQYATCVVLAVVVAVALGAAWAEGPVDAHLAPVLALPVALARARAVATVDGSALNPLLGKTAGLLLAVTGLAIFGVVASL
jgi:1,4-dihydroxy-2-naphthoate octaprenyltransferase